MYLGLIRDSRNIAASPKEVGNSSIQSSVNDDTILPLKDVANLDIQTVPSPANPDRNGERLATIQVDFPNGVTVPVDLVQFVPPMPSVSIAAPLREIYDDLAAAAEGGDAAAARWLFRQLRTCTNRFEDIVAMESAIAGLKKTGHMTYPDGRIDEVSTGPQTLGVEDVVREQFETCAGVTQSQIDTSNEWLEKAAESGDFLAMRDYAVVVLGTKTLEGFEMYKKTWDKGHLGSASAMAIFYRNGAPSDLAGQPDMLTSYAYTLISNNVYKSIGSAEYDSNGLSRRLSASRLYMMDQLLSRKGGYLTPSEVEEAEHLAISMLLNNEACCLGNWLNQ